GIGRCADLHAFAPNDVWCVTDSGTLFRWDGERWFAAIDSGALVRWRGYDHLEGPLLYADGKLTARFVARAPDDLYVTGDRSTLPWNGTTWRDHASLPAWLRASTVLESGTVLAVGHGGRIVAARGSLPAATVPGVEFSIQHIVIDRDGAPIVAGYGDTWGRNGTIARLVAGELKLLDHRG